jgi:tRNA wybutosine-synthesizing protein 1
MEPRATSSYSEETVRTLEKQGYHLIGAHRHSAVKTCLWLRKSLRGEGNCYKGKFYGIQAHRCIQMTPSLFCNQRCVHCWRPLEAFTIDQAEESIRWDQPEELVEASIAEQKRLVSGFKGSELTPRDLFDEAMAPKHAAISLIGEPTLYPYLKELIRAFHAHGMTTFVVTNGTNPQVIREIRPYQLYISLNAPDEATYAKTSQASYWPRIQDSLDELRSLKGQTRRVIRITCIAGLNMISPEGYAELLARARPDYIEVKAYMHLGYSRKRLSRSAMPSHAAVKAFAREIAEAVTAVGYPYAIEDESEISRVVLLASGERA